MERVRENKREVRGGGRKGGERGLLDGFACKPCVCTCVIPLQP